MKVSVAIASTFMKVKCHGSVQSRECIFLIAFIGEVCYFKWWDCFSSYELGVYFYFVSMLKMLI
jgi:hypothetical protein